MLGPQTETVPAAEEPLERQHLAEACRGIHERLRAIKAGLAAVRAELDEALDERARASEAGKLIDVPPPHPGG